MAYPNNKTGSISESSSGDAVKDGQVDNNSADYKKRTRTKWITDWKAREKQDKDESKTLS